MTPPTSPGLIPLLIGVTGHRNLCPEDRPALEDKVRGVLRELQANYPHTPLVVLSPLADGADRLVARVAVELGLALRVPLPLPLDVYRTDFADPNSRDEFDALMGKAEHKFELPVLEDTPLDELRSHGPLRNKHYDQLGEFVARHSAVLIALWDGKPNGPVGGTAQIVNWRLTELPRETASSLQPPDPVRSGPVVQVVTPRLGQPRPENALAVVHHNPPGLHGETVPGATYRTLYGDLDRFNALAQKADPDAVTQSAEWLFPAAEAAKLPLALRQTRAAFATADVLAIANQKQTRRVRIAIYSLVLLSIYVYQIADDLFHADGEAVLLYPVLLVLAVLVNKWAKARDFANKYQDYRALAEGLRVQFFWRLAGLTTSAEAYYLRRQRTEMNWVRTAIRVLWGLQGGRHTTHPATPAERDRGVALTVTHWVEDQAKFFTKRTAHAEHKMHFYERLLNGTVLVSMVWSLAMGLAIVLPSPYHEELHHALHDYQGHWWWLSGFVLLSVGLPLAAVAVGHGYREGLDLGAHSKQYEALSNLFVTAREQLKSLGDLRHSDAGPLLVELGTEALAENGDWVLMHRDRPLELPHAR